MHVVKLWCENNGGWRHGILAKEGNVWDHIVVMDCPIDVVKVPTDDDSLVEYVDYPAERAAKVFIEASQNLGITERARHLLDGQL